MTAVNLIRRRDDVLIITDGLMQGTRQHSGKVVFFSHAPACLAVRGAVHIGAMMYGAMATRAGDAASMIDELPHFLREMTKKLPAEFGKDTATEVTFAGWSRRERRFKTVLVPNHDGYASLGYPAYSIHSHDESDVYLGPGLPDYDIPDVEKLSTRWRIRRT